MRNRSGHPFLKFALGLSLWIGISIGAADHARADTAVDSGQTRAETFAGNYLAALMAGLLRDTASAARFYSETLKFDPRGADLTERAFVTLLAEGEISEAMRLAELVGRKNPSNAIAQLALGVQAFREGQFQSARSSFKRSGRGQSVDLTGTLLTAWSWASSGNPKRASDTIDRLPADKATSVYRDLHAGLIAKLNGRADEAATRLKLAFDADRTSVRQADLFGRYLATLGRKDEALTVYLNLQSIFPRHPVIASAITHLKTGEGFEDDVTNERDGAAEVLYGLGSSVTQEGDELVALIYLRLALWLKPGHAMALIALAETYERMKQFSSANSVYEQIPVSSSLHLTAAIQRALNLVQLDQADRAVALLQELAVSTPESFEPLLALGNVHRSRKDFSNAAVSYSKVIDMIAVPSAAYWNVYYARGISYERLKRWPEAEADFRKALELAPDQPMVLNYLGYSWVDRGMNLSEAFRMLQRAVDQKPNDAYIIDSLGWAHFRLGKYAEALTYLEQAVALRPADPTLNDHLGDIYWQLGRVTEAKFQWNHARDLGPEPEDLPKILEKIEHGWTADQPAGNGG